MSGTRRRQRIGVFSVSAALLLTACWGGGDDDADPTTTTAASTLPAVTTPDRPVVVIGGTRVESDDPVAAPLGIRLSEGSSLASADVATNVVTGAALEPAEIAAILGGLPAWVVPPSDPASFDRPADTLPPPLVGATVDTPFPPAQPAPADPNVPATGPLRVLRHQPDGDVDIAPFISLTFDQPMVPLGTVDQLSAADVPATITPAVDGRWRWIGTRTLRFELIPGVLDRLPAATEYRVDVPAGTTSANGAALEEAFSWTFATPPPTIEQFVGESASLPLVPVFVIVFDQRVDPEAVLDLVGLDAGGDDTSIRIATRAEIDADDAARLAFDAALDERAVAFVPTSPLEPDTQLAVTVGPGTPSAEGPRTSDAAVTYHGSTFGSLQIDRTSCDSGDSCAPGSSLVIEFNNPLDPASFDADMLTVDPAVPGLRIDVYGNIVSLSGATAGRTTYGVDLSGELTDVYGQSLGSDAHVEFRVGSAPPEIRGLGREWITTDPAADVPGVGIATVNHDAVHVRAWAVSPADIAAFRTYLEQQYSDEDAEVPEWPLVLDTEVEIDAVDDQFVETVIDLSSAFNQSGSQLVVRVDPVEAYDRDDDDYWRNRPTIAWVQHTNIGIDAIVDGDQLVIWTTDLSTGEPLDGVPVELLGDGRLATTDEDGLATLELQDVGVTGLFANAGDDTALLRSDDPDGWQTRPRDDESRWYLFDDRGIYRPGETTQLTGWVRRLTTSTDARLELFGDGVTVSYVATDAQGNELSTGAADVNPLGGFDFGIDVPAGANLGQAVVELRLSGSGAAGTTTTHVFQIQEFRTPEFEVSTGATDPGPYVAARPATVSVDARYFAGGPLPDAQVDWAVSTRTTGYSPAGHDDFVFGRWQPWWYEGGSYASDDTSGSFGAPAEMASDICFEYCPGDETTVERFSGRTDGDGHHDLQIDFDGADVDLPTTVSAAATVFDVNRQAWSSTTDLLVHPASWYVGLRTDRAFVRKGTPLRVDAIVTDIDGNIVSGAAVDITAGRLEWAYTDGRWAEVVAAEETCTLVSSVDPSDGSMRCEFATDIGGEYRITAIVTDDSGHHNRTELTHWVSGGAVRPNRDVEQEAVTIVPDRQTYAPGDTAQVLLQAPFAPASGIATISRNGILSTEPFDAADGSAIIEIPISDELVPNVDVQVDMVGSQQRIDDDGTTQPDAPRRPAFATGSITLSVPPVDRTLSVVATPASDAVEPGTTTSVTVAVTGPNGQPVVGADVAVVVVDEAVLSLTGYQLPDPLGVFYAPVWTDLNSQYLRSTIELTRTDLLGADADADTADAAGGLESTSDDMAAADGAAPSAEAGERAAGSTIDVRSDFDALALYAPGQTTGPDGTVTVDVPLPDSLTRYRVMTVAVDGAEHFGTGESTITARLPLQVRPSAPRFLNYGDHVQLPVVVQNQTDADMVVDVAIEVANLVLEGPAGQRVTVPANDRIELRFPVTTDRAGTARFRVAGISGDLDDGAAVALPVYTPATTEAFATYGVVDDDGAVVGQPIIAPTDVFAEFGGLEFDTSATALQSLTDAVLYLTEYRYDSSDGLASRIMAIAGLRDVLAAFHAEGLPDAESLEGTVNTDVSRLVSLQNDDGGFPFWQRGRASVPWQSIQSAHALVLARTAGYSVPTVPLQRALDHLASIEEYIPPEYPESVRNSLSAYALHVRSLAGQPDAAKAADLYQRVGDELELDAVAWLWPSITDQELRDQILTRIQNSAVETAGAVTFATSHDEDAYVIAASDRKTDGIILDALVTQAPDIDLIPKTVAGLLGNQVRGRWNNAQENAFILLALDRYFDTYEDVDPNFVARMWLGDLYASEHQFVGRTTDRNATLVPMAEVIAAGDTTLVVAKEGVGRLYYRLGLRYAPTDLTLDPRDEGFVVDRTYEAVDDPADVRQDPDGSWHVRAGATVRVSVTMAADARRTNVALIDPLPAGFEPVNPAIEISPTVVDDRPDDGDRPWYRAFSWFEHQNLRDDRAEAFSTLLSGGTYEYTYVVRATSPGSFVAPPARAEEMYAPEVFGRSASAVVVVE